MSGDQKNPEERVPEPENSSDPEPGTAEHSVQMFAQEHFLEHVQGFVLVVHQLLGEVEQRRLHFADKICESLRLTVLAPEGDPFITCLFDVGVHILTSRSWETNGSEI